MSYRLGSVPGKDMQTPPSEVARFLWKMRNVLKRMKNQFSDFYFLSYGENLSTIENILSTKMTITRKIKIG